jgi:hypothetical protein
MSQKTAPPGRKLLFDEHPRLFGVVLVLIAIIFALWAFYFPIHDALQGAPKVALYPKAIYICVMFTIFGATCIIHGPNTYNLSLKFAALRGWNKWITIAAVLIPSILIAEQLKQVLKQFLESLGFKS